MKKRIALIVGVIALGCLLPTSASESTPFGKLEFSRFSAQYHKNGNLKRCKLSSTQKIAGYQCQRWLRLYESGKLEQIQLAAKSIIQALPIPADSTVFFHPDGKLRMVWFSKNTTIKGLLVRGGGKIATSFHPNGRVSACFLTKETVIDGVPCSDSVFKPVFFHANGKLKKATLSKAAVIQGISFKKGSELLLTDKGKLKQ
jgi:hypothetical protein